MKKQDLKSCDWVEMRNGEKYMFILKEVFDKSIFANKDNFMPLSDYFDDLTCYDKNTELAKEFDIMKVWRMNGDSNGYLYNGYFISDKTLIWERKEVREMTMKELANELGYEVKIIKE